MSKLLALLVLLVIVVVGIKLALATLSFMVKATALGVCGIVAVGVIAALQFYSKRGV